MRGRLFFLLTFSLQPHHQFLSITVVFCTYSYVTFVIMNSKDKTSREKTPIGNAWQRLQRRLWCSLGRTQFLSETRSTCRNLDFQW